MTVPARNRSAVAGRTLVGLLAAVLAFAVLAIGPAGPAAAHVDLVGSDPANVSTAEAPVDEIRLTFSSTADPVVDEFELVGTDGATIPIASVRNEGENVLVVTPSPAPAPGRTRLTWAIRSGDSHTMTGTVTFTVVDPAAGAAAPAGPDVAGTPTGPASVGAPDGPARGPADVVAAIARWLVYLSLLFCTGGIAYLAWVHRGSALEGRWLVFLVRRAAVLVLLGAVVEWMAQLVVFDVGDTTALWGPGTWADLAASGFGRGTALRLAGALLVLSFLRLDVDLDVDVGPVGDGTDGTGSPGPERVGTDGEVATVHRSQAQASRMRVSTSPVALLGAAALLASEMFIGHTATTDPRALVVLADAVHLAAAGTWAAGAAMLALTLGRRRARGERLDARLLATRFSVLAAWSLGAVALTGLVLAWSILGGVGALWGTEFGRLLLLKLALVGVVAAIGAHNNRVLVPDLTAGAEGSDERFRRSVSIEAVLFGVVLLVTAGLVASSPT